MRTKIHLPVLALLTCLLGISTVSNAQEKKAIAHDMNAPRPTVVTPGKTRADPPSHAIVLFDGTDLSEWVNRKGGPAGWSVKDGYVQVNETGIIKTKRKFGSCHLHVEWATPSVVKGKGQGRGNSGVFLMSTYEVQVLDSYNNDTYPDGQAAAIYGRKPPMVNASRPPGEWQTYDIIFHRPIFKEGEVVRKATFTVFHNGVLVHDHFILAASWTIESMIDVPKKLTP